MSEFEPDIKTAMLTDRMPDTKSLTSSLMVDIFDNSADGYGATLLCPKCGNDYLHHVGVIIYDREEDQALVTRTIVVDGVARTRNMKDTDSGNPSARRNALAVQFWCEICDANPQLTIEQHKGNTRLGWRYEKAAQ